MRSSRLSSSAVRTTQCLCVVLAAVASACGVEGSQSEASSGPMKEGASAKVTERSFESSSSPALSLDAPEGWRIEFDAKAGNVVVVQGDTPAYQAPAFVVLTSNHLAEDVNLDSLAETFSMILEGQGFLRTSRVPEPFRDLPAMRTILRSDREQVCAWFVKRAAKYVTTAQCWSRSSTGCEQACAPVFATLKWGEPPQP